MTDRKDKLLTVPEWNYNGISQVPGTNNTFVGTSFVQILKDSGYHTIHCGKAHFGAIDTPGEDPHHWGFEVNMPHTLQADSPAFSAKRTTDIPKTGNRFH